MVIKKKTDNGTTASMVTPHVRVASKPEHVGDLRATWRRTREHYQAQALRFFGILAGLLAAQVLGNVSAGKPALPHFTSIGELWLYLLPVTTIAYRQWKPALGAKAVDSAPGVTIVPNEVTGAEEEPPDDGYTFLDVAFGVAVAGLVIVCAVMVAFVG